jgi:heme A synthase
MRAPSPEKRPIAGAALAAAGWALMLAVLAASAYIRMSAAPGADVDLARGVHRASASLAGLAVLLLAAWALWRRRIVPGALAALALIVFLAVLGRATGSAPPPAAALGNLAGGAALAALLAWIFGRTAAPWPAAARERRLVRGTLAAAAAQAAFGAWLATCVPVEPPSIVPWVHAATGVAAAALAAWLGVRLARAGLARAGIALIVLAALALGAGAASLLLDLPTIALLAHPLATALLLSTLALLAARIA